MTFINKPDERTLTEKAIEAGIMLARYYLAEALRLYTADELSEDQKNALTLLDWLRNKWPYLVVSLAEIENRGPNALRKKLVAEPTVATLIEHGWLIPTTEPFTIEGRVRRDCLKLHPNVKGVSA